MTGLNTSVSADWYIYTNLDSIITIFTPVPNCTGSEFIGLGCINPNNNYLILDFNTKTKLAPNYSRYISTTIPNITAISISTGYFISEKQISVFEIRIINWRIYSIYYLSAIYCLSGWSTIDIAGYNTSSIFILSGIYLSTKISTNTVLYPTDNFYYYIFNYKDKVSVLKNILKPKKTIAIYCSR